MAVIGNFYREGDVFTGNITTLALKANATLRPVEKVNDQAPDFRLYASGVEIGAAWIKRGQDERMYLSVKIDDPSFPAPIYGRLMEDEANYYQLLWNR